MRMTRFVLAAILIIGVPTYAGGSAQKGPTSGAEMMPPFDPRYFLGEWEIEWNPPETGLVPPGKRTGTETITHVNNRYLAVAIVMENEDGTTLTGDGVMAARRRPRRLLQHVLGDARHQPRRARLRPQGAEPFRVAGGLPDQPADLDR